MQAHNSIRIDDRVGKNPVTHLKNPTHLGFLGFLHFFGFLVGFLGFMWVFGFFRVFQVLNLVCLLYGNKNTFMIIKLHQGPV